MDEIVPRHQLVVVAAPGAGDEVTADVLDCPDYVELIFHGNSRPAPAALHAELVEAVFALPAVRPHVRLRASLPAGQAVLLREITRHCDDARARVAGSTCLVDGVVADCPAA